MPTTLLLVENASATRDPRVWSECTSLRDHGWHVVVVCPRRPEDRSSLETVDGVTVARFEPWESPGGPAGYVAEYARAMKRIWATVRHLSRGHRFDVVHAANPPDILLATSFGPRRDGAATIFDQHDLSPELYVAKFGRRGLGHRALIAAEWAAYRLADVVIATNESFRETAISRGGKDPADVFVVRNGPDPTVFRPAVPSPAASGGARYLIGYAGLMGSQDGVLEAIEALGTLRRTRSDWRAVFAGEGEMLPHARTRAAELGLADAIDFVGFIDDRRVLVELLGSCDVCLSPEPRNPLNDASTLIKVAEYMALAKPVVAFDLKETRFTAGDAAVYANSVDEFGAAVSDLLDDPARRQRMGQLGRERVVDSLAWERSEESLLAAYERALDRARARGKPPSAA